MTGSEFYALNLRGERRLIARIPGALTIFDVAPDGRFLINVEAGSGTPPITLLLNWKPTGPPN